MLVSICYNWIFESSISWIDSVMDLFAIDFTPFLFLFVFVFLFFFERSMKLYFCSRTVDDTYNFYIDQSPCEHNFWTPRNCKFIFYINREEELKSSLKFMKKEKKNINKQKYGKSGPNLMTYKTEIKTKETTFHRT